MLIRSTARSALASAIVVVATSLPAAAHPGHGDTGGFVLGFLHPMSGLDHILAMVSVGLLAGLLGGRALWALPLSFMAMMAGGAALAMTGFNLPFVELAIALSVIVLGAAVALQMPLPISAAVAMVGFFAVFHGFAHGAEMPLDASGAKFGGGFLLATAILHLAGLAAGFVLGRSASAASVSTRVAGGVIAAAGLVLAAAS